MGKRKKTWKLLIGKKTPITYWGLRGCSHGMYARGGYNCWFYGLKGIFGVEIEERWGCFIR